VTPVTTSATTRIAVKPDALSDREPPGRTAVSSITPKEMLLVSPPVSSSVTRKLVIGRGNGADQDARCRLGVNAQGCR
jgi:hypothetical protein